MFHKLINVIKVNYLLKKKNIKILINKKDLKILKIFIKLNLISSIKINHNTYNVIFHYIDNEPTFKNIKNLFKTSNMIYLNLNQIKKINKKNNSIIILSTNKGLITNFEAEQYKIGGIVVLKIKI